MRKQAETTNTYNFQPPTVSFFSVPKGQSHQSKQSKDHFKKPQLEGIKIPEK